MTNSVQRTGRIPVVFPSTEALDLELQQTIGDLTPPQTRALAEKFRRWARQLDRKGQILDSLPEELRGQAKAWNATKRREMAAVYEKWTDALRQSAEAMEAECN